MNITLLTYIIELLITIGVFFAFVYIGKFISSKIKSNPRLKNSRILNPLEYFPSEEVSSLKQVFYLVMIIILIIIILYLFFGWEDGVFLICILDIITSVFIAVGWGKDSLKDKFMLFLLIPIGSLSGILFGEGLITLLDIFHIIGYLYFIKGYYRKFVEYTENNGLGITILLLFGIILTSFLFTIIVEHVSPMDSITMVSNAFTSNSFEASGKIMVGKLNSLVLAWSGFILSGVGTATLAVSMVKRYVNREFDDMKEIIKKNKK